MSPVEMNDIHWMNKDMLLFAALCVHSMSA